MENQNEDKIKCPFCGYEIEKGSKRCPNCASVIENESGSEVNTEEPGNTKPSETIITNNETISEGQKVNRTNEEEQSGQTGKYQVPYQQAYNVNKLVPPAPKQITNGIKVALTALCVMLPIFGQFLGLVLSIIYMNSDDNLKDCEDRRSFGLCLLIASVIAFIVSVFWGFVMLILVSKTL